MNTKSRSHDSKRRRLLGAAASGVASSLLPPGAALAQQGYPNRALTFICPWGQGGTSDRAMRGLCRALARELGQDVRMKYIAGASGMFGTHALANARPDGYTIGQIPISVVRFAQLDMVAFDPLRDLSYLARTSGQTFGIVVRNNSLYRSIAQLVEEAGANPGKLSYATAGIGSASHIGMVEFLDAAGVTMQHIPFKAGAPALRDFLAGQMDVLCDSASWAEHVASGKVRILAIMSEQRLKAFSTVPTLKELGFNVVADAPNGVGAPAGLAPEVGARLRDALKNAVFSSEFKRACEQVYVPVMYQNAEEYRRFVLAQYQAQKRLIDRLKLREQLIRA